MFVRLRNGGFHNNCSPLSLIQRDMVRDGFPIPAIIEATNGELAGDVKDAMQCIRDATVSNSHGRDVFDEYSSDIKDEILSFNDLVHNAEAPILTKPMWDAIMRCPHGYFDGRAVMGDGEALDLDGLVIVRLDSDGLLEPVDGSSSPIAAAKHLIFFDGCAHFEALASPQFFRFILIIGTDYHFQDAYKCTTTLVTTNLRYERASTCATNGMVDPVRSQPGIFATPQKGNTTGLAVSL